MTHLRPRCSLMPTSAVIRAPDTGQKNCQLFAIDRGSFFVTRQRVVFGDSSAGVSGAYSLLPTLRFYIKARNGSHPTLLAPSQYLPNLAQLYLLSSPRAVRYTYSQAAESSPRTGI